MKVQPFNATTILSGAGFEIEHENSSSTLPYIPSNGRLRSAKRAYNHLCIKQKKAN